MLNRRAFTGWMTAAAAAVRAPSSSASVSPEVGYAQCVLALW